MRASSIDRELTSVAQRFDLLQHPFYKRWVAGELSRGELAYYAGQYAHVVQAIPRWLSVAAASDPTHADTLRHHASEESTHIAMWEEFAAAIGVEPAALRAITPNPATASFIDTGDELAARGQGPAAVWAIEAQSPAVSAEKLRGLREHYGIGAHNGGEYFAVHQELDREHEAQLRSVMTDRDGAGQVAAIDAATATLRRMWDLLSAVQAV